MVTGFAPAMIGSEGTPTWRARTANCSCAAGRCTSSEASSTFLRSRFLRRSAILAALVVLPEPCNPTIITTTGGTALRLRAASAAPAQPLDQMVVDDLHHHLRRRHRAQHLLADRLLANGVDEILDHR